MNSYRLPHFESLDSLDRFDHLVDVFTDAKQAKILPLAQHASLLKKKGFLDESKIISVRNRLFSLGYLKDNPEDSQLDQDMKAGLLTFQKEASLSQSGSIDQPTWQALLDLTNFENKVSLVKWYHNGQPLPALDRAIRWRLFVLGFLKQPVQASTRRLRVALNVFLQLCWRLKLSPAPLKSDFSEQSIAMLFDTDQLLEAVAKAGSDGSFHLEKIRCRKNRARRVFEHFLGCLTKVELWLYGYDVLLNGVNDFNTPPTQQYDASNYISFSALQQFWMDTGLDEGQAWTKAQKLDGLLFNKFDQILKNPQALQHESPSDHVFNLLSEDNDTLQRNVWNGIQKLEHRIWDGLRRAWSWLCSRLHRFIKKTEAWVKNLSKLAFHFAQQAFPVVDSIIEAVTDTISTLTHRVFPGSTPNTIYIQHDLDFDFNLFINADAKPKDYFPLLEKFRINSNVFATGIEIMGTLIEVIIQLSKKLILGLGWLGFILGLVHTVKELRTLGLVAQKELNEK